MMKLHRWVGLVVGLLILVAAGTALGLNHQDWFLGPAKGGAAHNPYERYVLSLWTDPRDARHLLAGTSDGLFRSADGGKTWADAVLPIPAEQVVALRGAGAVVYAAFRTAGIYKSDDGGDLWEEVSLPFNPAEGTTIQAMDLASSGLVVITPKGLYTQTGVTWQHEPVPTTQQADDARWGLKLLYNLHDGKFWGRFGVPVTDAVSLALIALVLSGYFVFFKRWFRIRRARAALVLLVVLTATPVRAETQVRYVMGTLYTIEAEGPNAPAAIDRAFKQLHHYDDTLSTYKPTSELSRANAAAGRWSPVSADTAGLVARALGYARESQGAFDPTVGPLVGLWGFKYLDYHEPAAAAIAATQARVGYAGVSVDPHRLKLARPGMALDLGAIAKGFAVDRAVALLQAAGMTSVRVDAGGNQGVWAARPRHWLFGVKHPRREGDVIGAISLDHGGISTSGDAERGFWKDGTRYGHILDPKTGRPVAGMLEVTVAAPTAEEADALSTTLYVLGVKAGTALLAHHPGCAALFIEPGSAPGTYKLTPTPGLAWQPAPEEDPQP